MTIVQERLDALATLTLKNGSHPDPELQASALDLLDRMIDPAGLPRRSVA